MLANSSVAEKPQNWLLHKDVLVHGYETWTRLTIPSPQLFCRKPFNGIRVANEIELGDDSRQRAF